MDITSSDVHLSSTPTPNQRKNYLKVFRPEDEIRVSPNEARNILLVIVTLIATVTFEIGVNPPGGVWQDNEKGHVAGTAIYAPIKNLNATNSTAKNSTATNSAAKNSTAGISIRNYNLREISYFTFLFGNTLALSTSVAMMLSLTEKFPLRLPTYFGTICMVVTYCASVYIITPDTNTPETAYVLLGLTPLVIYALDIIIDTQTPVCRFPFKSGR